MPSPRAGSTLRSRTAHRPLALPGTSSPLVIVSRTSSLMGTVQRARLPSVGLRGSVCSGALPGASLGHLSPECRSKNSLQVPVQALSLTRGLQHLSPSVSLSPPFPNSVFKAPKFLILRKSNLSLFLWFVPFISCLRNPSLPRRRANLLGVPPDSAVAARGRLRGSSTVAFCTRCEVIGEVRCCCTLSSRVSPN